MRGGGRGGGWKGKEREGRAALSALFYGYRGCIITLVSEGCQGIIVVSVGPGNAHKFVAP